MSNNQMMNLTEGKEYTASDLKERVIEDKPALVHEIDHLILKIVRKEGPLTRPRLVALTGIARSTLYDSLRRLSVKGYVTTFSEKRKEVGRPKIFFMAD
ncbi:MAG: winged helix-turn-helix transcriptional regulator [Candidatus Hodarchaeales archaeon]|jgi:DNA-binding PadR family transcriptional regulator